MSEDVGAPPPEGFILSTHRGPFSEHNGPLYHREDGAAVTHGFRALRRHCNGYGVVHGGMLASFVDGLLGHAVGAASHKPSVTIHLSLDYLSMARAGEWIEGEGRVTKLARELAFAEAHLHAGGKDVLRAAAVFKLMERRGVRSIATQRV